MKQKILLSFLLAGMATMANAQQKNKSAGLSSGYAITAAEKGGKSWKEVNLVNIQTGEILKTVFTSKTDVEPLNARTGKPIVKKENTVSGTTTFIKTNTAPVSIVELRPGTKRSVNLDEELNKVSGSQHHYQNRIVISKRAISPDQPFATNSAALAFDKKHERLYYTPMGINQLRYIDLKSGKLFYFEDEAFGVVKNTGDVANQITRMVIAADGNGYALSNDANHLIRFTTSKKAVITDLGSLTDDGNFPDVSVHQGNGYGGDMVADASGNLILITAHRNVFKINIENKTSSYLGTIKGLPRGFSTNGAMVEEGNHIIIASSESTLGYYRFDLKTLQAEKVSTSADVFNASDLANATLLPKEKKESKAEETAKNNITLPAGSEMAEPVKKGINVFPNPVTNGVARLSFANQPAGRYQVQLLDLSGRLLSSKEVNINGEVQMEELRFPELSVKGNYLVRITSENNKINITSKLVVQ